MKARRMRRSRGDERLRAWMVPLRDEGRALLEEVRVLPEERALLEERLLVVED